MHALRVERSCALVATALSDGRRRGARLVSGERRSFGVNTARTAVTVPYPALSSDWTLRSLSCGIALQCAPSKDRIAEFALQELSPRELLALTIVEGEVALGWVHSRWPGLLAEFKRLAPELKAGGDDEATAMLDRAQALARTRDDLRPHPLLGKLPNMSGGSRSEEHTSELQSLMRISYAVF